MTRFERTIEQFQGAIRIWSLTVWKNQVWDLIEGAKFSIFGLSFVSGRAGRRADSDD